MPFKAKTLLRYRNLIYRKDLLLEMVALHTVIPDRSPARPSAKLHPCQAGYACRVLDMPSALAVLKLDVFGFARQLLLSCSTLSGGFSGKSLRVCALEPVGSASVMFDDLIMRFRHERLAFGLWLRSAVALSLRMIRQRPSSSRPHADGPNPWRKAAAVDR